MRRNPRRARVDVNSPRAWATDDRSGFIGNHENLVWQHDWSGPRLLNKKVLVFPDQLDKPQRQLGSLRLPPDPVPVQNARVEPYALDELWPMMMEAATRHGSIPIYLEESSQPDDINAQIPLSLELSTIDAD